jgi:hypothetical protein
VWGFWETILRDVHANVALYSHRVFVIGTGWEVSGASIGFRAQGNVIYLGTSDVLQFGQIHAPVETFLQVRCPRYQDVDIQVKLEILGTANAEPSHWFGITTRALRPDHWDAYLFYIRQNGTVEFGIKGGLDVKPLLAPEVSSQPVTVRLKVEGNRIQTWVNDRACHDWVDKDNEFVRKGDVYLISYAAETRIHEVEIKAKKWYAPVVRFAKRFWKAFVIVGIILGVVAAVMQLLGR